MGSKFRLLPWIMEVLDRLDFDTALDAFSGSGCVSYLLKALGKEVTANDFLNFSATITKALVENAEVTLSYDEIIALQRHDNRHLHFIERTFSGIFFTTEDLRFLDRVWWNIRSLENPYQRALTISALVRSWLSVNRAGSLPWLATRSITRMADATSSCRSASTSSSKSPCTMPLFSTTDGITDPFGPTCSHSTRADST